MVGVSAEVGSHFFQDVSAGRLTTCQVKNECTMQMDLGKKEKYKKINSRLSREGRKRVVMEKLGKEVNLFMKFSRINKYH